MMAHNNNKKRSRKGKKSFPNKKFHRFFVRLSKQKYVHTPCPICVVGLPTAAFAVDVHVIVILFEKNVFEYPEENLVT